MAQSTQEPVATPNSSDASWRSLYIVGGATALITIGVGIAEILISFLPGGSIADPTVAEWFAQFQQSWFLGLRNMGLLNIFLVLLGVPTFLALYGAHRRVNPAYAALAVILSLIGVAVFLATNRAFAMYELSRQYAAATTDVQQAALIAAGQTMLSVGRGHTPGSFLAFFLSEVAGIVMSAVMLKGRIFSKAAGYAGLAGFSILLVFDVTSAFAPGLDSMAKLLSMVGGLLTLVWQILVARGLFQLAKEKQPAS